MILSKSVCCPFCKNMSSVIKKPWWHYEYVWVQIQCAACGTRGPRYIYDGVLDFDSAVGYAVKEWNKRFVWEQQNE